MTAEEIRDIGFASWKDPDAWMESMQGQKWESLLKSENKKFKDLISLPSVKERNIKFKSLINPTPHLDFVFKSGSIEIRPLNSFFLEWRWLNTKKKESVARDIVSDPNEHVWLTTDIGEGAELFELQHFSKKSSKPLWKLHPVGPDVAVVGSLCFYLGVSKKLWYNELWACNKYTGENKVLIYKETDPHCNLSLRRGENNSATLIRENSQDLEFYEIQKDGVIKRKTFLTPLPKDFITPLGTYGIDWIYPSLGLLSTKVHGKKMLWRISTNSKPKLLLEIPAGQLLIDSWSANEGKKKMLLLIETPNEGIQRVEISASSFNILDAPENVFTIKRFNTTSKDGTSVSYTLIHKKDTRPSNLLIIGYGAYGMPTTTSYVGSRWNPLIQNNWGIVYTFLRGGGDHTDAWAKAGRRSGREKTIDDFIACIQDVKQRFSISSRNIVIYGRSAGGLLVGNALERFPDGSLFRGIFTEVPYVDELRTTSNPDLPLTQIEYNEFGDPVHNLSDFLSIGLTSPADAAIGLKTPTIFIYCKTATNDSQVYTYEPIKWVTRLRNSSPIGAPKVVAIDLHTGHFTPPELVVDIYALDASILDAWINAEF